MLEAFVKKKYKSMLENIYQRHIVVIHEAEFHEVEDDRGYFLVVKCCVVGKASVVKYCLVEKAKQAKINIYILIFCWTTIV